MKAKVSNLSFCLLFLILSFSWGDSFTFSADKMSTVLAKGKERTLLTGNARILSDKTEITAGEIELFGADSRYALCSNAVTVKDSEKGIILRCENLFYDRDNDISRVEGYAEMEDQKNELVVKGGFLEHFGDDEITIIQIGVRILKEDMACRSEFARYRRDKEILELSGMPFVYWKGDEYRASRIIINLDTDEIRLEGEVTGTVTSDEEENTGEPAGSAPEPPPGGNDESNVTEEQETS